MIILHEKLPAEAGHLKRLIEQVFVLPVAVCQDNLDRFFPPLEKFGAHYYGARQDLLQVEFPNAAVLLLTRKDLYDDGVSKDDEWVFGASSGRFCWVATARLMGEDNSPRASLAVDNNRYLGRLSLMAIHELGHDLARPPHYQQASWVSLRNNCEVRLGLHCDDNTCVMYESVDLTTPPSAEGYLKLGEHQLFDAGLDDHLQRLRRDWFCSRCQDHICVPESYHNVTA